MERFSAIKKGLVWFFGRGFRTAAINKTNHVQNPTSFFTFSPNRGSYTTEKTGHPVDGPVFIGFRTVIDFCIRG